MRKTPIDLYRMGNATSSRIDNIRLKDIETYEEDGDILVVAGSGGISTFAVQGAGKNWWKLDRGTDIPSFCVKGTEMQSGLSFRHRFSTRYNSYKIFCQLASRA
ncbi:hypothetical protein N0Y54_09645 [Nostoc punctiforme UO1]|uniref:hypothetical protein n=1 Tax=Nostoc punctiforme TaxID=272131 RepID=UPI0030B7636A